MRWHTGASDELTVERRGPGRTPPEALAIVREHGATHSNMQIAKMLNDVGLRTGKNLRFTPRHVAGVRGVYKIFTLRAVAVQDGEISVTGRATAGHPGGRDLQLAAPRAGAPPWYGPDGGASRGTPRRSRSTGRRWPTRSGSSRTRRGHSDRATKRAAGQRGIDALGCKGKGS